MHAQVKGTVIRRILKYCDGVDAERLSTVKPQFAIKTEKGEKKKWEWQGEPHNV